MTPGWCQHALNKAKDIPGRPSKAWFYLAHLVGIVDVLAVISNLSNLGRMNADTCEHDGYEDGMAWGVSRPLLDKIDCFNVKLMSSEQENRGPQVIRERRSIIYARDVVVH